jgi:hypothetical protein
VGRAEFVSSKDYNSSNLYGNPLGQRLIASTASSGHRTSHLTAQLWYAVALEAQGKAREAWQALAQVLKQLIKGKAKGFFDEQQIKQVTISLSHTKENAIAVVILEK